MAKLYIALLLGLIWALVIVKTAGGEDSACFISYSYNSNSSVRERVLGMVKIAGFNPNIADKVIQCESGWNPDAVGDGGKSWGLWQIHQPSHNLGTASFDPYLSTVYAIELLDKNGWTSWTCAKKLSL